MYKTSLELKYYGIEHFSFKSVPGFKGDALIKNASIKIDKEHYVNEDNELQHFVILNIEIRPKKKGLYPYIISLRIIGLFEVAKEKAIIADINGSSILYGAAREYIYMATAHGRLGSVMLPTTSFAPPPSAVKK